MTHETDFTNKPDGIPGAIGPGSLVATIEMVMTRHLITVAMDEPLHQIQRIFEREGFHRLLVIDEGEVDELMRRFDAALEETLTMVREKGLGTG